MSRKHYAVVRGKEPGIYTSWEETKAQVDGYKGALYKGFKKRSEAEAFLTGSSVFAATTTEENVIHEMALPNKTLVYSDGSYKRNRAGYGVVILAPNQNKKCLYGRVPSHYMPLTSNQESSNNIAELYAIDVALAYVQGDVLLYTDSYYAMDSLTTYIHAWKPTQVVPNRQLIEQAHSKMANRVVEMRHVDGHSGIRYNVEADRLAEQGRLCNNEDDQFVCC